MPLSQLAPFQESAQIPFCLCPAQGQPSFDVSCKLAVLLVFIISKGHSAVRYLCHGSFPRFLPCLTSSHQIFSFTLSFALAFSQSANTAPSLTHSQAINFCKPQIPLKYRWCSSETTLKAALHRSCQQLGLSSQSRSCWSRLSNDLCKISLLV